MTRERIKGNLTGYKYFIIGGLAGLAVGGSIVLGSSYDSNDNATIHDEEGTTAECADQHNEPEKALYIPVIIGAATISGLAFGSYADMKRI